MPHSSNHELKPIDIKLNHGDIYIMSKKQPDTIGKQRSKVRACSPCCWTHKIYK